MSQNTLKVNELYDDADLDESGIEADDFDEKLLKNDGDDLTDFENDLDVLQGMSQRVLDATQLYLGEIGFSPLLTAEEEVFFRKAGITW